MTKMKAPRIPKGENPKTTIKLQERQITVLLDRLEIASRTIGSLTAERDAFMNSREKLRKEHNDLVEGINWSEGYIARVKETDKMEGKTDA